MDNIKKNKYILGYGILIVFIVTIFYFIIFVFASTPTVTSVYLNSTTNGTCGALYSNLTGNWSINEGGFKNVTLWYLNNRSIALVYLPFENNSNSSFTEDYSDFGNNGKRIGLNWSSAGGYDGFGAYTFNRSNYISLTNKIHFKANQPWSVSWWSRLAVQDISTDAGKRSYGITGSEDNQANAYIMILNQTSGSVYRVQVEFNGTVATGALALLNFPSGATVNLNNWHSWVVTTNGTNTTLYIDGKHITSAVHSSDNMTFGVIGSGYLNTNRFNGTIDDFAIWNRTLTREQVVFLNNSKPILSSAETTLNDVWHFSVVPVNASEKGSQVNSSYLQIVNTCPAADTCSYLSGNWNVNCADNCQITSPVNLGGNNIYFTGAGEFYVKEDITKFGLISLSDGCKIVMYSGKKLGGS